MKHKVALLIGRFQPFHLGHLYLLKKTLEIADKIVVGIGSASIYDKNNPLDYETRKNILKAVFYKEQIEDKLEKVVPLEDFFNDKKWLENVKKKVGNFDVVVSNNEWTSTIMEKAGYQVKRFPYYKRELYEGWRIRKLAKQKRYWLNRVPKYLKNFFTNHQPLVNNYFNNIVIGGTFDHFHKGHKALIKSALKYGRKAIIGVTSDNFVKNKFFSKIIQDFDARKNNVSDFLKKEKVSHRALIIKINNFIGDLDKRKNVEAIIVSKNTYFNALKINDIREKRGLKKIRIILVHDIIAEDKEILSSERIRKGEIDRNGKSYWLLAKSCLERGKKELIMPDNLREELRKPLGQVFKNTKELIRYSKTLKWKMVIAVGDIVVGELIKNGIEPDIKVIDFRSRRRAIPSEVKESYKKIFPLTSFNRNDRYVNKPGTINIKTAEKLKEIIDRKSKKLLSTTNNLQPNHWLVIDGEEDLLTLPAILFAPLGSLVLYGHFQYGAIGVEVTEEIKSKIDKIISQFT